MIRPIKLKMPTVKPAQLSKLGKAVSLIMKGLVGASLALAPAPKITKPRRAPAAKKAKPATKGSRPKRPKPARKAAPKGTVTKPRAKATPTGFTQHRFAGAHGSRDYKLYIPATGHARPLPLVVMLHGCTQSPDDFALGTQMNHWADKLGFLVAYPAQSAIANPSKCWNWFKPADQKRGSGEPALIAGITRQIIRDHRVDPLRVYVAGLSAGGAAAAIMAETYPDIFAAVGVHSGVACGAARDMLSGYTAMTKGAAPAPRPSRSAIGIPLIVFHGDGDRTVHPSNAEMIIARRGVEDGARIVQTAGTAAGASYTRTVYTNRSGKSVMENWRVHKGGHAWFGGNPSGSYATAEGPDASEQMVRFFLEHANGKHRQPPKSRDP